MSLRAHLTTTHKKYLIVHFLGLQIKANVVFSNQKGCIIIKFGQKNLFALITGAIYAKKFFFIEYGFINFHLNKLSY